MKQCLWNIFSLLTALAFLTSACAAAGNKQSNQPVKVLAVETFLADIAQNVAGDRIIITSLFPIGMDPHTFQPTSQDVTRIADSQLLIVNGTGLETWLSKTLDNAGGQHTVVEAASGLASRQPGSGEIPDPEHSGDPHFWLDPNNVIKYAENIRDALSLADPAGKSIYAQNTDNYINRLKELDQWIRTQVNQIPPEKRLLVTNHESFGYFADRYGFTIIGTVIPSTSSEASPSAKQMAALIDHIRQNGVKAIFLETGANPQLANQIAQETGVQVITDMYTDSITTAEGAAPNYIEMMKHDVALLAALK